MIIEVTDELNHPGVVWKLHMHSFRATTEHKATSMTKMLCQRYITGVGPGFPAIAFPAVGGQEVEISHDLFEAAGQFWAMQAGAHTVPAVNDLTSLHGDGTTLSPEQLIAMAACAPNAWAQLFAKCTELQKLGNALGGSVGSSQESASNTHTNTPNTSHEQTGSSAASTTDSEQGTDCNAASTTGSDQSAVHLAETQPDGTALTILE